MYEFLCWLKSLKVLENTERKSHFIHVQTFLSQYKYIHTKKNSYKIQRRYVTKWILADSWQTEKNHKKHRKIYIFL
jgi:hypothetical protein